MPNVIQIVKDVYSFLIYCTVVEYSIVTMDRIYAFAAVIVWKEIITLT